MSIYISIKDSKKKTLQNIRTENVTRYYLNEYFYFTSKGNGDR